MRLHSKCKFSNKEPGVSAKKSDDGAPVGRLNTNEKTRNPVKTATISWNDGFYTEYESESGDTQTAVENILREKGIDFERVVSIDATADPIVVKYY